jgi:pheromone shutdown protein TraB
MRRTRNLPKVLSSFYQGSKEEMGRIKEEIREHEEMEGASDAELEVALVEALKSDTNMHQRLFKRLELEVPEFTRAFVMERDYIMAEAIRREGSKGAHHVVAVVGAANVTGMVKNLQESWRKGEEASSIFVVFGIIDRRYGLSKDI